MTLRAVNNHLAGLPKLFIYWADIDLDAYMELLEDCMADYFIVNYHDVLPAADLDLRYLLHMVTVADVVMLPDTWWTEVKAHQVVQVAGWFGCKLLDYEGTPVETVSLSGVSQG